MSRTAIPGAPVSKWVPRRHRSRQLRPRDLDAGPDAASLVHDAVRVLRRHLGMEVAFVGRVIDGHRQVEYVDADPSFSPLAVGDRHPLRETLCGPMLAGALPAVVHDARAHPASAGVSMTTSLPIGAYLSVPVRDGEGRTVGTLCCFSRRPDRTLGPRHADLMRAFAEVVGTHLAPLAAQGAARRDVERDIREVLDAGGPTMALQPIVDLRTGAVTGYEALARFPHRAGWTVEDWFDAADRVGMAGALEASAVHAAMSVFSRIPSPLTLAVNVSARSLSSNPTIVRLLPRVQPERVVLEITEHHQIDDTAAVHDALAEVRAIGAAIAIDDTGTGYSGLERLLALRPEILKLDGCLVQGIHDHPGRQAMCEAMVGFTRRVGARLVAERIEEPAELRALKALGVSHGQGYLLGTPGPPDEVLPPGGGAATRRTGTPEPSGS